MAPITLSPLDIFMDVLIRILFIGTPIGLWVPAIGLFRFKGWGRISAISVSVILSVACLIHVILGLGDQGECRILLNLFRASAFAH